MVVIKKLSFDTTKGNVLWKKAMYVVSTQLMVFLNVLGVQIRNLGILSLIAYLGRKLGTYLGTYISRYIYSS